MINYALRVLEPVLRGKASSVEVKYDAERKYVYRMQEDLQKRVWSAGCQSVRLLLPASSIDPPVLTTLSQWYIREDNQWNSMSYPWSQAHFWYRSLFPKKRDWMQRVRFGDYSHPQPHNKSSIYMSVCLLTLLCIHRT